MPPEKERIFCLDTSDRPTILHQFFHSMFGSAALHAFQRCHIQKKFMCGEIRVVTEVLRQIAENVTIFCTHIADARAVK